MSSRGSARRRDSFPPALRLGPVSDDVGARTWAGPCDANRWRPTGRPGFIAQV